MNGKMSKYLMTHPKAMMDYQATRRLPQVRKPLNTPLRELLMSMGPRERMQYRGIRLSPKLGYNGNMRFDNGEQLLNWLGSPYEELIGQESLPSESWAIRNFRQKLTKEDLASHCAQSPNANLSP